MASIGQVVKIRSWRSSRQEHDATLTIINLLRHAVGRTPMPKETQEDMAAKNHCLALRWKMMLVLSAVLIALGICLDWSPSQDAGLPDTSSFLLILGVLLGCAGLLTATHR